METIELNILLIGSPASGKTSYVKRLQHNDIRYVSPTIGIDLNIIQFTINKNTYILNIWDTGDIYKEGVLQFCKIKKIDTVIVFRGYNYNYICKRINYLNEIIKENNANVCIINIWSKMDLSKNHVYYNQNIQFYPQDNLTFTMSSKTSYDELLNIIETTVNYNNKKKIKINFDIMKFY